MLSVVRDVTEQRRAEETSAISELRYRRLFESAMDGILILDAQSGMVTDVNPYLMSILGFSHRAVLREGDMGTGVFRDVIRK